MDQKAGFAAATTATRLSNRRAEAGDPSFMNNVPDPLLSERDLPTFKFELREQAPHALYKGGREWRVDSSRFPIAKTITGVVLDLDPGALRELHGHPSADEWQYLIEGQVSVTMFGSHGRYRTETLD